MDGFRDRPVQPLRHLSGAVSNIVCDNAQTRKSDRLAGDEAVLKTVPLAVFLGKLASSVDGKSAPDKFPHRFRGCRAQCSLPVLPGKLEISCAPMQVTQHGVPEVGPY